MSEISRRRMLAGSLVIAGAAGGAAFGITRPVHHRVALPPPAPPAALTRALVDHQNLLASYDAVSAAGTAPPALAQLRTDIAAHIDALRAVLEAYPGWRLAHTVEEGTSPSDTSQPPSHTSQAPGSSPAPVTTVAALRSAVLSAAARLNAACVAWPQAESHADHVVPLLGSIAACLATHAEVLS